VFELIVIGVKIDAGKAALFFCESTRPYTHWWAVNCRERRGNGCTSLGSTTSAERGRAATEVMAAVVVVVVVVVMTTMVMIM